MQAADSRGRGKLRPYQVLHDTKKQASLCHRIDAKQADRTEVASDEPAKPPSRLHSVRFAHARKPGGASPAPTKCYTTRKSRLPSLTASMGSNQIERK
ncbi:MAG: hypothetical protein AUH86_02065 [Acidobacteria bacterium 13_1_40CM_4_58_4]|nr:MAG: hypothetical protein AUH86_02065 [Acidobacteria bacterium 13_1_40CM_4_58_4]